MNWTTKDELEWLCKIGQHHVSVKDVPRARLLENYIAACHRRGDWGSIKKDVVIKAATAMLEEEATVRRAIIRKAVQR